MPPADDRRSGFDRRSGQRRHRRQAHEPERRAGQDRRLVDERRSEDRVSVDSLSLGRRLRQPQDDHLARPADHPAGPVRSGPPGLQAGRAAGPDPPGEPAPPAGGVRRVLPRLPAPRPALGVPHPRDRLPLRLRDATEIIFLSWLVNCLVPAKLGDLYRAYLLKINSTVSLSRTFGTVFIERVLDLFAIVVFGLGCRLLELPRAAARSRSRSCSRSASSS